MNSLKIKENVDKHHQSMDQLLTTLSHDIDVEQGNIYINMYIYLLNKPK
jgi:hypothetical protein